MTRNLFELIIVILVLVALPLLLKRFGKAEPNIELHGSQVPDLTDDPTGALLRAFPEGDTSEIGAMLRRLGFKFGLHSGFIPDATPEDINRIISGMFGAEGAPRLISEFNRYRKRGGPMGYGNVQLAVLRLSAGDPGRLESELKRAKTDYRDVILEAESMHQFVGSERPLAPGVTDRTDQVFREYALWLCRWLIPTESRGANAK